MIENKYDVGDLVTLSARFRDPVGGAYIQPDAVTCEVLDPTGATRGVPLMFVPGLQTPDGVSAPGFVGEVDAELPGRWYYRFDATGAGQSAEEGSFYVQRSAFGS